MGCVNSHSCYKGFSSTGGQDYDSCATSGKPACQCFILIRTWFDAQDGLERQFGMFFKCNSKGRLLFTQGAFNTGKMYGLGAQKMVAFVTSHVVTYCEW